MCEQYLDLEPKLKKIFPHLHIMVDGLDMDANCDLDVRPCLYAESYMIKGRFRKKSLSRITVNLTEGSSCKGCQRNPESVL